MNYADPFLLLAPIHHFSRIVFGLGGISETAHSSGILPPRATYLTGGLGCATALGLGLALGDRGGRFLVVEGDGGLLHSPSCLFTLRYYNPPNLTVLVIENLLYGSTGGHPLPALQDGGIDLLNVLRGFGFSSVVRCSTTAGLRTTLTAASTPLPAVILARVNGHSENRQKLPEQTIRQSFSRLPK